MDKVKSETELKLNSDLYNTATRSRHLMNEIMWSTQNYHIIKATFDNGRGKDLADVKKAKNKPIICVGSGPSLDHSIEYLKEWKGDIICSTSQATTLVHKNITPTYIVNLDPDTTKSELEMETWDGINSAFITHPGVMPEGIEYWVNETNNPIYYFRKFMPQTVFYDNAQKIAYSVAKERNSLECMINQVVVMLGCVVNCQISIANILGYSPVYLVGCDFGYMGYKSRFDSWRWNKEKGWHFIEGPPLDPIQERLVMSKNGVPTVPIQLFYKRNMISAWRLHLIQLINTAKNCITELPYCDIKTVIKNQGKTNGMELYSDERIIHDSEKYMAQFNLFVIRYQKGIEFMETDDGLYGVKKRMLDLEGNEIRKLERERDKNVNLAISSIHDKKLLVIELEGIDRWYRINLERIMNNYKREETEKAIEDIMLEVQKDRKDAIVATKTT